MAAARGGAAVAAASSCSLGYSSRIMIRLSAFVGINDNDTNHTMCDCEKWFKCFDPYDSSWTASYIVHTIIQLYL